MARRKIPFAEIKKSFPQDIDSELISKQFLQLAQDRYPSSDKALQNANSILSRANIQDPVKLVHAKIIILSLMRDLVRQVDPSYTYNSPQHRDEVFSAIIEALEGLEEELEELEEDLLLEEEEEEGEQEIEDVDIEDFGFNLEL